MPAFVTHSLFGRDVLDRLGDQPLKEFIQAYLRPFYWGLQGPDLLYYHGVLSPVKNHTLNRLGSAIHKADADELFFRMGQYLLMLRGPGELYPNTLAYALGFLCHYSLDSVAHPFIYYWQDEIELDQPVKRRGRVHNKLESDIDSEIYYYKTGKTVRRFRLPRKLIWGKQMKTAIARFYADMIHGACGCEIKQRQVRRCVKDAFRVIRMLLGKRSTLFWAKRLDALSRQRNVLSAHVRRLRVEEDVLNLNHRPWSNPCGGEEQTESYPELEEQALELALSLVKKLWLAMQLGCFFTCQGLPPFDNGNPEQNSKSG